MLTKRKMLDLNFYMMSASCITIDNVPITLCNFAEYITYILEKLLQPGVRSCLKIVFYIDSLLDNLGSNLC